MGNQMAIALQSHPRGGGRPPMALLSGMVLPMKDGKFVPPSINVINKSANGTDSLVRKIGDFADFKRDLTELLVVAGFGGPFNCSLISVVKGTTHTKGLHVKTPAKFGVHVTAHYGSNDSNVLCHLGCPSDVRDPHKFFEYLRNGEMRLEDESEETTAARRKKLAELGVGLFAKYNQPAEKQQGRVLPDLTAATPPAPPPAPPAAAPAAPAAAAAPAQKPAAPRLRNDPDSIAAFMELLQESASPDGYIPRSTCLTVLVTVGLAQTNGSGIVLKSLITAGHLTESGDGERLRFRGKWLTAWQKKAPQPTKAAAPELSLDYGELSSLDALTDEAARLRTRRDEVQAILSRVAPNLEEAKARVTELQAQADEASAELAQIDERLADPELKEAGQKLVLLQRLLRKAAV